jgi:hypothetical protein
MPRSELGDSKIDCSAVVGDRVKVTGDQQHRVEGVEGRSSTFRSSGAFN